MDADDEVSRVRSTTARVLAESTHVTIDPAAVAALASSLHSSLLKPILWDEGGMHYFADAFAGGPLTAQYIFVLDALNWCFWPTPELEYDHLARSLKAAIEADAEAFSADRLACISAATASAFFLPLELPEAEERAAKLRELGAALRAHFGGQALNMVKAAHNSAVALVDLVVQHLPGFRDSAVYRGRQVFFYKRAQILVADVWAAYGAHEQIGAAASPAAFPDMGRLTTFADYRVPQLLRAVPSVAAPVLRYAPALAARVAAREELPAGSEEECEIRAATVQAVEALREQLAALGRPLLSVQIDWLLWQRGEVARHELPPHHRVRTVFY